MSVEINSRFLNAAFSQKRLNINTFEDDRLSRTLDNQKAVRKQRQAKPKKENSEFKQFSTLIESLHGTSENKATIETISAKRPPRGTNDKTPPIEVRAENLKKKVHFCFIEGILYAFNGICYDVVSDIDVVKLYRSCVDFALDSDKGMGAINQLYNCLLSDETIPKAIRKRNLRIAVLKNGIYDAENMTLLPHSPENIVCYYIDANYIENGECPCFDNFLYETFDSNELYINRFWLSVGYLLLETLEGKVFFFMGLARDSGKSLVGRFIESLFPEKYVSNIELNDFNRNFAIAPIVGAVLNTALDMPASKLNAKAVSKLKKFTGGDALNINQKFQPEFKYRNSAKFLFASNHPILLNEDDDAFWSRVIYLPFNHTVPYEERDSRLLEKFQKEKDAIVSKALRYTKQLIDNNFQFPTDYEIEKKIQSWRGRTSDSIECFLEERCVISNKHKGELVKKLYRQYEDYCVEDNQAVASYNVFKQYLEDVVGLKHFKMRDGGENTQSAFRSIKII
ncbi:MAG: hypothetical protein IKD04_04645 [Clostridia bacterium]|nr:hypothetical protein [Clostridia bacterium]